MRDGFTASGIAFAILGALYLVIALVYLQHIADLTGVSAGAEADGSGGLSRYIWTARIIGIGGVVFLAMLFGYFKRAGGPVPELLLLVVFAAIEAGIITSVYVP